VKSSKLTGNLYLQIEGESDCVTRQYDVEFQTIEIGEITFERYCLKSDIRTLFNGTSLSADSISKCGEMTVKSG